MCRQVDEERQYSSRRYLDVPTPEIMRRVEMRVRNLTTAKATQETAEAKCERAASLQLCQHMSHVLDYNARRQFDPRLEAGRQLLEEVMPEGMDQAYDTIAPIST